MYCLPPHPLFPLPPPTPEAVSAACSRAAVPVLCNVLLWQVVRQLPNMQTNPCKKGTYGVFGTYLGYKKVRLPLPAARCDARDVRCRATRARAASSSATTAHSAACTQPAVTPLS